MTFELPTLTLLAVIVLAAVALVAVLLIGAVTSFFVQNHQVRVARHEPVLSYYGHLVLGH